MIERNPGVTDNFLVLERKESFGDYAHAYGDALAEHLENRGIKLFMNIDSEPRLWRTSLDLPGVLASCRGQLPGELPDDVNVLNGVLDKLGVLKAVPYHKLAFPTMSAVICNSEAVAHEVVYGRRVIGGGFLCKQEDMLDPGKLTHGRLRGWLEQDKYAIAADPETIMQRYAHLKNSDVLIQEARAAQQSNA